MRTGKLIQLGQATIQGLSGFLFGTAGVVSAITPDGWIPATGSWSYASASTINVPTGAASIYQKGDKLKLTQPTLGVKYFYIITVADTLLTVTGGTWDYINGIGLQIAWILAAGPSRQGTADTWYSGEIYATSAVVNCLDSNSNKFFLAGVQFELGSVATPFEFRDYQSELTKCQRYYCASDGWQGFSGLYVDATYPRNMLVAQPFPVKMRGVPVVVIAGSAGTVGNLAVLGRVDEGAGTAVSDIVTTTHLQSVKITNADLVTGRMYGGSYTASAEL
jgi:hypothetical protein